MKKGYVDIVGKWAFVFAYDINYSDLPEISEWLEALGAPSKEIDRACDIIMLGNKAFTFSNKGLRMSVVCIGWATSKEQFWDSVVHELDHVQQAIIKYYDVDCDSEEAAYLQGYLMRGVIKVMKNS